jgi:5-methylcytosine-specific restriction enzyme A
MPTLAEIYDSLRPTERHSVYSLLQGLKYDVSDWIKLKKLKPAQNPKYCYNWSFDNPKKSIAACIWHPEIQIEGNRIFQARNLRGTPSGTNPIKVATWKRRAKAVDGHLQAAYFSQLPIHAIIIDGRRRDSRDPMSDSSKVDFRKLDPVRWAVTEYDFETGNYVLLRGAKPVVPFAETYDPEAAGYDEGEPRRAFRQHRHREWRARKDKIDSVLRKTARLVCEVVGCGFDFERRYGELGKGYAHVHHRIPLGMASSLGTKTKLEDLAVVCPNCHAMIHLGGACRNLDALIPPAASTP